MKKVEKKERRAKKAVGDRGSEFRIPPFSGPVIIPRENESEAIRTAPAYDMKKAAQYLERMSILRRLIGEIPADHELTLFGHALSGYLEKELRLVRREIGKLTADGHRCSMIMADPDTMSGVSFRSGEPMCAQSTVKAVYTGALLEDQPEAAMENGRYVRDAIVFSDNGAYERLRRIYGPDPLIRWCLETGVDTGFALPDYPRDGNARDMLRLWTRLYEFFNGGKDVLNFGAYYADTSASATRKQLSGRCPVQTKAGWEHGLDETWNYDPCAVIPERFTDGDPSNDECAINDTGIVYTKQGPYLFVIYTDHPFGVFRDYVTPNPLYGLSEALYQLKKSFHNLNVYPY